MVIDGIAWNSMGWNCNPLKSEEKTVTKSKVKTTNNTCCKFNGNLFRWQPRRSRRIVRCGKTIQKCGKRRRDSADLETSWVNVWECCITIQWELTFWCWTSSLLVQWQRQKGAEDSLLMFALCLFHSFSTTFSSFRSFRWFSRFKTKRDCFTQQLHHHFNNL